MTYLGLKGLFRRIYAIDDTWKGKPDEGMLDRILADAGLTPSEALFVGDRYDVDLRLPEQRGCPVYLSQSIEQLLRLEEILGASGVPRKHFQQIRPGRGLKEFAEARGSAGYRAPPFFVNSIRVRAPRGEVGQVITEGLQVVRERGAELQIFAGYEGG